MINSKKVQFVIILLLSCVLLPVLAAEPNEPNQPEELKFQSNIETMSWEIETNRGYYRNPGPIKPSFVAKILLPEDYPHTGNMTTMITTIKKSSISKEFSKKQQEFIETELIAKFNSPSEIPFYQSVWLYAVSEKDAKLMVKAYLDGLSILAEEMVSEEKRILKEYQDKLKDSQDQLIETQKQLDKAEETYNTYKTITNQVAQDSGASDLARQNIIEMNKKLNELNIELSGIKRRLMVIEEYKNKKNQRAEIYERLDEMFIELTIELSGLEARKETTEIIRQEEQRFLSSLNNKTKLSVAIQKIEDSIEQYERKINSIEYEIQNPRLYMQSPKVYLNIATIYPVITD